MSNGFWMSCGMDLVCERVCVIVFTPSGNYGITSVTITQRKHKRHNHNNTHYRQPKEVESS